MNNFLIINTNPMKEVKFSITIKDVEKLEKAHKKSGGDILTDANEPLELLCRYCGFWSYNDYTENNHDYINEQEEELLNELDYQIAFIDILNEQAKEKYKKDINLFDEKVKEYQEKQIKYYKESECFIVSDILESEMSKKLGFFHDSLFNEYLNGTRSGDGVLSRIEEKIETLEFLK